MTSPVLEQTTFLLAFWAARLVSSLRLLPPTPRGLFRLSFSPLSSPSGLTVLSFSSVLTLPQGPSLAFPGARASCWGSDHGWNFTFVRVTL